MTTQVATSTTFTTPAQAFELRRDTTTSNQSRLQCFSEWWRRIRERHELMTLSDRELADFMCSKADARAEASKWFWEA